jgi:hypothetical protein
MTSAIRGVKLSSGCPGDAAVAVCDGSGGDVEVDPPTVHAERRTTAANVERLSALHRLIIATPRPPTAPA